MQELEEERDSALKRIADMECGAAAHVQQVAAFQVRLWRRPPAKPHARCLPALRCADLGRPGMQPLHLDWEVQERVSLEEAQA